jgi:hypothetical protein
VTKRDQSETSIFAICEALAPKPDQSVPKQHQIVLAPSYFSQQRHLFLRTESLNCLRESIGVAATALALYQTRLSIIHRPTESTVDGGTRPADAGNWGLADDECQVGGRAE